MSRTAMLVSGDDLIAIILGYSFLNELSILTPVLTTGIVISVVSVIVFSFSNKDGYPLKKLLWWVLGYSFIWGLAAFSWRVFALKQVALLSYTAAWYSGSWLGSLFTRYFIMGSKEAGQPLTQNQLLQVLFLAICVWTSGMLLYWMRQILPITKIQPIQMIAEMSIPALLGLGYFGERKKLSRFEIRIIIIGIIGAVLVAMNFDI